MKLFSGKKPFSNPRRLAIDCALLLGLHLVMLEWMARSHVIERIMAMQVNVGELALILTFILSRLLAYFLVPSALAAILVWEVLRRFLPADRK